VLAVRLPAAVAGQVCQKKVFSGPVPPPPQPCATTPVPEVAPTAEAAPEILPDAVPEPPPPPAVDAAEPAAEEPAVELIEADWEDEIWAAPEVLSLGEVALGAEEAEVLLPPQEEAPAETLAGLAPQVEAEAEPSRGTYMIVATPTSSPSIT
jgi:hypothetical protein